MYVVFECMYVCTNPLAVHTRGHLDLAPSAGVELVLAVDRIGLSEPVVVEDGRVLVVLPVQNRVHPILCNSHSDPITHYNTSTVSQKQYAVYCVYKCFLMGNLPQYDMAMVGLIACKVCSTSRVKAVWWVTMPVDV